MKRRAAELWHFLVYVLRGGGFGFLAQTRHFGFFGGRGVTQNFTIKKQRFRTGKDDLGGFQQINWKEHMVIPSGMDLIQTNSAGRDSICLKQVFSTYNLTRLLACTTFACTPFWV